MYIKSSILMLLIATGAFALDTSSLARPDSSAPDTAAKERLHKSLALPTSYPTKPVDAAARERLHQSLALPTSYGQDLTKSVPAAAPQQADTSKPFDGAQDITAPAAAGAEQEEDSADSQQEEEAGIFMPAVHSGMPCPHHEGHMHTGFDFGSLFGPIISEAARDVFGAEQIITSQMHNIFEDLLSGPAIPHMLDMIEGAAGSAAARMPAFPLAPFSIRGPRFPATFSTLSQPMFGVVISSSSGDGASPEAQDESAQGPSWQQQVVIRSSDPSRLQQLADMFEQQLQGSSAGLGRKLKSATGRVQPADVAQVLLVAARKLRAAQAAQADK